jgi:hypothetical protein
VLYVSRRDGSVRTYDLRTVEGRRDWAADARDPSWQRGVSGVALAANGSRADLPVPRRFRNVTYSAELVYDRAGEPTAEKVSAVCDDVVLSVTMWLNGRSSRFRFDADRRGTRRFIPSS